MRLNLKNMPKDLQFLFVIGMQLAIYAQKMEISQDKFIEFLKGLWESAEMNDLDELSDTLTNFMKMDLTGKI